MFSKYHDIRKRIFIKCAKEENIYKLAEYVLSNELNGIHYGWKKDYDNLENEYRVLNLLHNGISSKCTKLKSKINKS